MAWGVRYRCVGSNLPGDLHFKMFLVDDVCVCVCVFKDVTGSYCSTVEFVVPLFWDCRHFEPKVPFMKPTLRIQESG